MVYSRLIIALTTALAACTTAPPPPCDIVPGELWAAGELPDGLPNDPADAIFTLYRGWSEARQALATIRSILDGSQP